MVMKMIKVQMFKIDLERAEKLYEQKLRQEEKENWINNNRKLVEKYKD